MSVEWNLANKPPLPISYKRFCELTAEFQQSVTAFFGTETALDIVVMDDVKTYTTYGGAEELDRKNKAHIIMHTAELDEVTPELWGHSRYVEVGIVPASDDDEAARSRLAYAEFRGDAPDAAFFSVHGDEEKAKEIRNRMALAHQKMQLEPKAVSNKRHDDYTPGDFSAGLAEINMLTFEGINAEQDSRQSRAGRLYAIEKLIRPAQWTPKIVMPLLFTAVTLAGWGTLALLREDKPMVTQPPVPQAPLTDTAKVSAATLQPK